MTTFWLLGRDDGKTTNKLSDVSDTQTTITADNKLSDVCES